MQIKLSLSKGRLLALAEGFCVKTWDTCHLSFGRVESMMVSVVCKDDESN